MLFKIITLKYSCVIKCDLKIILFAKAIDCTVLSLPNNIKLIVNFQASSFYASAQHRFLLILPWKCSTQNVTPFLMKLSVFLSSIMDEVEYSKVFFVSLAIDISCLFSLHFFCLENNGLKSSAGTAKAHTALQLASVIGVVPVYIFPP